MYHQGHLASHLWESNGCSIYFSKRVWVWWENFDLTIGSLEKIGCRDAANPPFASTAWVSSKSSKTKPRPRNEEPLLVGLGGSSAKQHNHGNWTWVFQNDELGKGHFLGPKKYKRCIFKSPLMTRDTHDLSLIKGMLHLRVEEVLQLRFESSFDKFRSPEVSILSKKCFGEPIPAMWFIGP